MKKRICHGPFFGGPLTEPWRLVVLLWANGDYSVHREDLFGNLSGGEYVGKSHGRAVTLWAEEVHDRIVLYGEPLWVEPEAKLSE